MQRFFTRISGLSLIAMSIAVLGFSLPTLASAQDRIVQAIDSGNVKALPGTVHPQARAEYDHGPVAGGMQLRGLSLQFVPSASQQTALTVLLKAQQDPSSPSYRKWLTTEQYAAEFGMTQTDIAKASVWLQSQGFTVDKVSESRTAISFSGTAAQAEAAFHTQIHSYLVNGETHFANATAVSLPRALASSVVTVGGLDNFTLKPRLIRSATAKKDGLRPQFTSAQSGSHFLAPGDFAVIYDLNPLFTAGFTGAGQTIGIAGQTDIVVADITGFRSAAGLPAYGTAGGPTFTNFLLPTSADPGISYNDLGEADLDLEWSGGVATNANIVFVTSTDVISSLEYAIANKINGLQIPILSMSYGNCEAAYPTSEWQSLEVYFQEANAQGQTVVNSSGDSGAAACDDESEGITSATQGLAVNYPASSAYVTGLGGSEFMGDGTAENPQTGGGTYWTGATGSNDLITSAKSYIPEMAWNDTEYELTFPNGGLSSGGGGVSELFAKPTWQAGVPGIPVDAHRDVPDVSLNASADHDPYLFCTQIVLDSAPTGTYSSSCVSGFRISDPGYDDDLGLSAVGGTSAAAPSFAGILALIEQKLGTQLGNINPSLYTLAANTTTYSTAFHDITTGNNEVPCTTGTPNCPTGSNPMIGYAAGTGYDQATGLGSVDGNNLATAFASIATQAGSTTTLTASPVSPLVGATVTLTATITPNTGTTTPTGTVTFTVDGTVLPAVALTAGVATTTTSFATGGAHSLEAAYSGDTNYFASSNSLTLTVLANGAPTTTTLTANPTTVALYGSITFTANVAAAAGGTVAGSVSFTIGATTVGTAQIVAGASGTGTATLAVSSATAALGFVAGTNTVTATYGGDTDYSGSSGTTSVTVTNPGLTLTVANMTISGSGPGNTGTSAVTVVSTGGYAGTVDLTATATSLNASYTINPDTLAIGSGATGTATISIQTIASSIKRGAGGNLRKTPAANNRIVAGAVGLLGCIFLLGVPAFRKRRWPMLTALLMLGALSAGIGCGGGGPSGASPKGTYTVTLTATDSANSAITTSTNFTVTIQ